MVAKTPQKQAKIVAPLNPVLLRETLTKVDRCMARLQELQFTVAGGRKVISGVSLSPRSTRTYLKTSLRCKEESARIKDAKSPVGKFPARSRDLVEWTRMSLPAMLVGETVVEILQASQFARDIVESIANKSNKLNEEEPKTPLSRQRRLHPEGTYLRARRQKEKQLNLQSKRSECNSPLLRRARSRINFKVSPPKKRDFDRENNWHLANRVSPKNRPWAKKTVLFPNPLFLSTPSQQRKFCKTRSPIIPKTKQTPHKFLIKSPPSGSKLKVKMKTSPMASVSPTRLAVHSKKYPKMSAVSKLRRSFSPSRLVSPLKSRRDLRKKEDDGSLRLTVHSKMSPTRLAAVHSKKSPKMSAASKLRRSFSPSRLVSPLKSRRDLRKKDDDGTLRLPVHSKMSPKMSKLRRSFSPSRLATRLVSPLKRKKDDVDERGRGHRPTSSLPLGISALRI